MPKSLKIGLENGREKNTYTSSPRKVSLIVILWTSVMVVIFIPLVIVLMIFGSINPFLARSANSVILSVGVDSVSTVCASAAWAERREDET